MKKLLLVATVLMGGVAASQAGLNISIGIGLPLPRPAIVIRHPVPHCPPPVYVAPICPPRVVVVAPAPRVHYRPSYWHGGPQRWRGHSEWSHHNHGHPHRR